MSDRYNIEELLNKKLEGLEIEPSGNAWLRTQRMLRRKRFLRFQVRRFNVFYAAGLVVVGVGLSTMLITESDSDKEKGKGKKEKVALVKSQAAEVDTAKENISYQSIVKEKEASSIERVTSSQSPVASPLVANSNDRKDNDQGLKEVDEEAVADDVIVLKEVKTMIAYFTASVNEGCAPLEVEFVNHSENAVAYQWSYGEGKSSQSTIASSQTATFNNAGVIRVTLRAYSEDGSVGMHSEIIIVHPKPVADFEITDGLVYNYSTDATDYSWTVSEQGEVIKDFQPDLEETSLITPDASRLFLAAKNMYGCVDTLSMHIPRPEAPTLHFPTAFSPNASGPSSGYYNPNEPGNDIFHPRFSEEPIQYQLTIYNRAGELIFQSNDIQEGWDGYYREAPVLRGVYVWKCTGKWKDGSLINQQGDITALWSN